MTYLSEEIGASGSGRIHQHAVVAVVRHVEVARAIHREATAIIVVTERHRADILAWGGDHGPVTLGIPLLDPGEADGDIEISGVSRRRSTGFRNAVARQSKGISAYFSSSREAPNVGC